MTRVFISYAWEEAAYQGWVQRLAAQLRLDGVDARLDVWDQQAGQALNGFMSSEVEDADRVLVLASPQYAERVRAVERGQRITGVGLEWVAIGVERFQRRRPEILVVALTRGDRTQLPNSLLAGVVHDLPYPGPTRAQYQELFAQLTGQQPSGPPVSPQVMRVDRPAAEPLFDPAPPPIADAGRPLLREASTPPEPGSVPILRIRLTRQGNALVREWLTEEYAQPLAPATRSPWDSPLRAWGTPERTGIEEVARLAATGEIEAVRQICRGAARSRLGQALFELALGPGDAWHGPLDRLCDPVLPAPTRQGVRVRIETEQPALSALPWSLATWHGDPLVYRGWSWETTQLGRAEADVVLRSPPRVVLARPPAPADAARAVGALPPAQLEQELAEILAADATRSGWTPQPLATATSLPKLRQALAEQPCELLWLVGQAVETRGQPGLRLSLDRTAHAEPREVLELTELANLLGGGGRPTPVVYLLLQDASPEWWQAATRLLGPRVAALLLHRIARLDQAHRELLIDWLHALLRGRDPVAAAAPVSSSSAALEPARAVRVVHAHHRSWRREQAPVVRQLGELADFDRVTQKGIALERGQRTSWSGLYAELTGAATGPDADDGGWS